jgi:hypothetical protein
VKCNCNVQKILSHRLPVLTVWCLAQGLTPTERKRAADDSTFLEDTSTSSCPKTSRRLAKPSFAAALTRLCTQYACSATPCALACWDRKLLAPVTTQSVVGNRLLSARCRIRAGRSMQSAPYIFHNAWTWLVKRAGKIQSIEK